MFSLSWALFCLRWTISTSFIQALPLPEAQANRHSWAQLASPSPPAPLLRQDVSQMPVPDIRELFGTPPLPTFEVLFGTAPELMGRRRTKAYLEELLEYHKQVANANLAIARSQQRRPSVGDKLWTESDIFRVDALGEGSFGTVWACRLPASNSPDFTFAAKQLKKNKVAKHEMVHEITIHSAMRHKNILPLFTYAVGPTSIYLLMEMAALDVRTLMERSPPPDRMQSIEVRRRALS